MIELSKTQRAVLIAAVERKDRCIYPMPTQLKGGAIAKVAGSLLKRGLVEEAPAKGEATVWRHDEDCTALTLRATKLARNALSEAEERGFPPIQAPQAAQAPKKPTPAASTPRQRGSAQQALVALLSRPEGATLAELQHITGWQAHSVRGALSGLIRKKLGHEVTWAKEERGRVYRITS